MEIEHLLTERKALRQDIANAMLDLKHALINSNLLSAQNAQKDILKARLRLKQINFQISTQYYAEEIACLERIIDENSKI